MVAHSARPSFLEWKELADIIHRFMLAIKHKRKKIKDFKRGAGSSLLHSTVGVRTRRGDVECLPLIQPNLMRHLLLPVHQTHRVGVLKFLHD